MNLTTLASLAGVSVSTVSKAFSGSREISEETREKIFAIARENGCFDKYNKNKFEKKVIAVICPEIISEYYSSITEELRNEIRSRGSIINISITNFEKALEQELYTYYSSYCKADGIIFINPRSKINNPNNIPTVAISPSSTSDNVDSLFTDTQYAINDAVKYLKEMGHTKIGFAGESLTMQKMTMFKNALRTSGIPVNDKYITVSDNRFEEAGADIVNKWLKNDDLPTAIIAAYDYIAIGAMKELYKKGYRIPDDISVIGMDDIARAPYLQTSLSSIHFPQKEICQTSVDLIMKKIENQFYSSRRRIIIHQQFIPRESTGKAPKESMPLMASCKKI